jgi:HD-like signal output (HDOD) protein
LTSSLWSRKSKLGSVVATTIARPGPDREIADGKKILRAIHLPAPELGPLAKLPPFQPVATLLLRLFDQENARTAEIVRLIESDPALSAELLAVANSALYAPRTTVTSPAQAVFRLGYQATKSLTAALGLRAMMRGAPRTGVVRRLWLHSVATATIGQQFAPLFQVEPAVGYVAGLLHDLGRLGLLAAHPEEYAAFAVTAQESVDATLEGEERQFGMTHCEAGSVLSRAWGMPETVCRATRIHHQPAPQDDIVGLIHLACQIADSLQFQAIRHNDVLRPEDTIALHAPQHLRARLLTVVEPAGDAILAALESLTF